MAGKLIVSREDGIDGPEFWIRQADDEVWIADELLEAIRQGEAVPGVAFGENILTIRGVNRTVSYGVSKYELQRNVWLAHKSPEVEIIED